MPKTVSSDIVTPCRRCPRAWASYPSCRRWTSETRIVLPALLESVGQLSNLETLYFSERYALQVLPVRRGQFFVLQMAALVDCGALQALPESVGQPSALQKLVMRQCHTLPALLDSGGQFSKPPVQASETCIVLQALPRNVGQPSKLQTLWRRCRRALASPPSCRR